MKSKLLLLLTSIFISVFTLNALVVIDAKAEESDAVVDTQIVATVGTTGYTTIEEAISNWSANTTLTLKADVQLTDLITLKSTEHHTLNLSTYTMTAASGKNAIEIACYGLSSQTYALTINADANNPGRITATSKYCIYYKKSVDSPAGNVKDRPIITINNGVFNGSYALHFTSNGNTNAPQIQINGGTFNAQINLTKCTLITNGGLFNASVSCTGDTNAYRLIKGGTFKSFGFMTTGSGKFTVGSAKNTCDVGCYVDENGYLVVGGPVINEPGEFKASTDYGVWSSVLQYSSVVDKPLYYETAEAAIKKVGTAKKNVTVYDDKIDLTGSSFKGTILIPEGQTLEITYASDTTPAWSVESLSGNKIAVLSTTQTGTEENTTVNTYQLKDKIEITVTNPDGSTTSKAVAKDSTITLEQPEVEGYDFSGWYTDPTFTEESEWKEETDVVTEAVTLYPKMTIKTYVVTKDLGDKGSETITVEHGALIEETTPSYTGHVFLGWFDDADFTIQHDFTLPVKSDITIYANIANYQEDFNNVNSAIDQLKTSLNDKTVTDEQLVQDVENLQTQIDAFNTKYDSVDEDLQAQIDDLNNTTDQIINDSLGEINTRVDTLKTEVNTLASNTESNSLELANLTVKLSNLTAKVEDVTEEIDNKTKEVERLNLALDDAEQTIDVAIVALTQRITTLEEELEAVKYDLSVKSSEIQELANELNELVEKVKQLTDSDKQNKEEIAELKAQLETAQETIDSALDSLSFFKRLVNILVALLPFVFLFGIIF